MLAAGIDLRLLNHLSRILILAERRELGMTKAIYVSWPRLRVPVPQTESL